MQRIRIRQAAGPQKIKDDLLLHVRITLKVGDLQKLVSDELHVRVLELKLYYGGKELTSAHSIADYKISDNDVVQFMIQSEEKIHCKAEATKQPDLVTAASEYYQIGDAVDVIYNSLDAWFEARIIQIFVDTNKENQNEEEFIFQVVMDRNEKTAPLNVTFKYIRPRAKYFYDISELQPEMVVFVNYNMEKPKEIGYWYDFKISRIYKKKYTYSLHGTLLLPQNHQNAIHTCSLTYSFDRIMKIEQPTLLSGRDISNGPIPQRKLALYCTRCKDVPTKDCKYCSCCVCGLKHCADQMIICDGCNYTYHLLCLVPPLSEIPAERLWYCPSCKTNVNEIVRPGENLKTIENNERTKKRNMQPQTSFEANLGIEVGTSWDTRSQISGTGIHVSLEKDIHVDEKGICSVILESEDAVCGDNGNEVYYTLPDRRRDSKNGNIGTKILLQESMKMVKQLASNCNNYRKNNPDFGKAASWRRGKPIRVLRSENLKTVSKFAPNSGYRYDGIYKLVEYFPELVSSEVLVWRFLLRRDDRSSPPWSKFTRARDLEIMAKKLKIDNDDKKIKAVIHGDSRNKTLWDECISSWQRGGKEEFLNKVEELFTCVCCLELVYLPITTDCNHNICNGCLSRCFNCEIYHCPSCRVPLDRNILKNINMNLHTALKLIFPQYELSRE